MNRFVNVVIGASLLALIYGLWRVAATIDVVLDAWTIVLVLGALFALALFVGLFIRVPAKSNFALLAASLIAAFAAGNWMLGVAGLDLITIFDAKVARPIAPAYRPKTAIAATVNVPPRDFQSSRPVDGRNELEVSRDLAAAGILHQQMRISPLLLPILARQSDMPFYPLSMGSNEVTIGCNEGDQRDFPIWRTDRYGYNNDDSVYARNNPIMIVGGSFAMGSCVHQDESLAGVLSRNGYPALSMGIGQHGPIATLATLKEYGEHIKPKIVLWQYFDPNDVAILWRRELRSLILLQYLRESFSQDLFHRQSEVDEFWRRSEPLYAEYLEFLKNPTALAEWEKKLEENLPRVRELLGNDITSLREDGDILRIFERVFAMAHRRVSSWGGKIVLVMIPNNETYFSGTIPKYQAAVQRIMKRLAVETIDVDQVLRAAGDPLRFYPRRGRGAAHLNAGGYALAAQQIMALLDADNADSASRTTRSEEHSGN